MLTIKGLVIRERPAGENDKWLTVLTAEQGVLEVRARGVRKQNAKNAAISQLYSYGSLCLERSRTGVYFLNSSELIRSFYSVRLDISRLSLALYFSEMTIYTGTGEQQSADVLRLFLNTLHYLEVKERSHRLLKPVFELRLMSEIGLVPNLIGCCKCYKYEDGDMVFDMAEGRLYCSRCCSKRDMTRCAILDGVLLHALRFIALSDMERIFSFRISKKHLEELSLITERYANIQLGRSFKTLEFYKSTDSYEEKTD